MTTTLIAVPSGFEYINKNHIETAYSMNTMREFAEDEFYADLDWFYQAHNNGNGTTCIIRRRKNLHEVLQVVKYFQQNRKNVNYSIDFKASESNEGSFSSMSNMSVEFALENFSEDQLIAATKLADGSWSIPSNSAQPHNLTLNSSC